MDETRNWTIKGIPHDTVALVRKESKARGMKQFEFIDRAIKFYVGAEKPTTLQILDHIISISKKDRSERSAEELALSGALKEMVSKL